MSVNAGTLFEAAGSAEAIEHYTGARRAARTFCDTGVALAPAAPALSIRRLSKCLNHRAESSARHGRIASPTPDARRPARLPAARRAGRDSGDCLVLSKQVIANQGVFVSARNWAGSPENARRRPTAIHSRAGDVFDPHVTFAQQTRRQRACRPFGSRFCARAILRPSECDAIAPESRPIDEISHAWAEKSPDGASHREEEAAKERYRCATAPKSGDPRRGTRWTAFSGAPLRGSPRPGTLQEIPVTRRAWRSAPPGAILCGWRCSCAARLSGPRA
jgi:hypothetical protein